MPGRFSQFAPSDFGVSRRRRDSAPECFHDPRPSKRKICEDVDAQRGNDNITLSGGVLKDVAGRESAVAHECREPSSKFHDNSPAQTRRDRDLAPVKVKKPAELPVVSPYQRNARFGKNGSLVTSVNQLTKAKESFSKKGTSKQNKTADGESSKSTRTVVAGNAGRSQGVLKCPTPFVPRILSADGRMRNAGHLSMQPNKCSTILPSDTKQVLGESLFHMLRNNMIQQHESFVHQVWELQRVVKQQKLLTAPASTKASRRQPDILHEDGRSSKAPFVCQGHSKLGNTKAVGSDRDSAKQQQKTHNCPAKGAHPHAKVFNGKHGRPDQYDKNADSPAMRQSKDMHTTSESNHEVQVAYPAASYEKSGAAAMSAFGYQQYFMQMAAAAEAASAMGGIAPGQIPVGMDPYAVKAYMAMMYTGEPKSGWRAAGYHPGFSALESHPPK